jgi:hypothetical protein
MRRRLLSDFPERGLRRMTGASSNPCNSPNSIITGTRRRNSVRGCPLGFGNGHPVGVAVDPLLTWVPRAHRDAATARALREIIWYPDPVIG